MRENELRAHLAHYYRIGACMAYTVQLDLSGDSFATQVAEIWSWVDRQKIEPPTFRYRMTDCDVVLRLDFSRLADAVAFGEAFAAAKLEFEQSAD